MSQFARQAITHTGGDVAREVRRQVGDESGAMIRDADIIDWINAGQRRMSPHLDIMAESSVDSAAGVNVYEFGDELSRRIKILKEVLYRGKRLTPITFQDAQRRFYSDGQVTIQNGTPKYWWEYNGAVHLVPTPATGVTDAILIYYSINPARMVALDELLSVPDSHFNALVQSCMQRAYMLTEEGGLAQMADTAYQEEIVTRQNFEKKQQNSSYTTIREGGEW